MTVWFPLTFLLIRNKLLKNSPFEWQPFEMETFEMKLSLCCSRFNFGTYGAFSCTGSIRKELRALNLLLSVSKLGEKFLYRPC